MNKKTTCALVSFGLAGHSEQLFTPENKPLSGWSTLSGYSSPDTWEPREETSYDAAVILDNRLLLEDNSGLAWLSPMPCVEKARCKPLNEAGPMDFISLEDYLLWWREKGAKIGHVMPNGVIIWHNGEVQKKKVTLFDRLKLAGLTQQSDQWGGFLLFDNKGNKVYDGSGQGISYFLDSLNIPTHA